MATIQETCIAAMELAGALAGDETPKDADIQRTFRAMRQMLESWGTERDSIYVTTTDVITSTGAASYTMGLGTTPVATLPVARPNALTGDSYVLVGTTSYNVDSVNEQIYNGITNKTITGIPCMVWMKTTFPNATLTFWPIPPAGMVINLVSIKPLDALVAASVVTDQLTFPPGYQRAVEYSLAEEIEGLFDVPLPDSIHRIAAKARRNIKRLNKPDGFMSIPSGLLPSYGGSFDIRTGFDSP